MVAAWESFPRMQIEGEPSALSTDPETNRDKKSEQPVVAWYGYVTSTPTGSQFDDYLVVSARRDGRGRYHRCGRGHRK